MFKPFRIGRASLKPGSPLIAGILNVTPDSFSDGGINLNPKNALTNALRMEAEGADIIDIGGESSRPGAKPISAEEEIKRVIPVIRKIRKKSSIPISIDTCKAEVAEAALNEGVEAINDITAFKNRAMFELAAKSKKTLILMHMKGNPRTMQKNPQYLDVVSDIRSFLVRKAKKLNEAGAKKIIIDPGIGFGKTVEHNLRILNNVERFVSTNYPVMIGASRKSFLGKLTGGDVGERLDGSIAVHILSALHGAAVIRVHDVAPHRHAIDIAQKIQNS